MESGENTIWVKQLSEMEEGFNIDKEDECSFLGRDKYCKLIKMDSSPCWKEGCTFWKMWKILNSPAQGSRGTNSPGEPKPAKGDINE